MDMTFYKNIKENHTEFLYPPPENGTAENNLCTDMDACRNRDSCNKPHSELEKQIWNNQDVLVQLWGQEQKFKGISSSKKIPDLPSNCPFHLCWACGDCWRLHRIVSLESNRCKPIKKSYRSHIWNQKSSVCLKDKEHVIRNIPEKRGYLIYIFTLRTSLIKIIISF